jgi:hypothetical protein
MPALDFPTNPVVGQLFATDDRTWTWNGTTWDSVAGESSGGGSATDIGVFYGFKTSNDLGRLYLQVVDDGSKITLPQSSIYSNGIRVRKNDEYKEWIFTAVPLSFEWDTVNPTHLLVQAGA